MAGAAKGDRQTHRQAEPDHRTGTGLLAWVNYLGGNMPTFALNFSRPGGQIVAQYYNFLRLGKEGYRKIHTACYETAQYLADEIAKMSPFEIIYDGR